MNSFKLLYFVIFIINLCRINAQISDKRLCVDKECKVPISLAKTLLRYSSPDSRILSFGPNVDITIYSKSAGSREDLWGGEINGKRGYVPKHMVRETKVFQKPGLLVDTEFSNDTETKQVPSPVEPDKVQEPYEVVDGTTIYLSPQEINPSSTDSPVQSTALPSEIQDSETHAAVDNSVPSSEEQSTQRPESQSDQNEAGNKENEEVAGKEEESAGSSVNDEENELEDDDEQDEDEEDDEIEEEEEELSENVQIDAKENSLEDSNTTEENKHSTNSETDSLNGAESEVKDSDAGTKSTDQKEDSEESLSKSINTESENENLNEGIKAEVPSVDINEVKIEEKETENIDVNHVEETSTSNTEEPEISSNEETSDQNETEPVQAKEEVNNEATVAPVEVTTFSPEIEVPQPLDDEIIEVTPNPLEAIEEPKIVPETIPTLPPLGLFAASNVDAASQENVHSEENLTDEIDDPVLTEEKIDGAALTERKIDEGESTETQFDHNSAEETTNDVSLSAEIVEDTTTEEVVSESAEPVTTGNSNIVEELKVTEESQEGVNSGFFESVMSLFESTFGGSSSQEEATPNGELTSDYMALPDDGLHSTVSKESFCDATSCPESEGKEDSDTLGMDFLSFNSDVFLYLVTTAISVIIFLFGYIAFDKSKREGPLIARINSLEKKLLVVLKENEILQEKVATESGYETNDRIPNEVVDNLKQDLFEMTSIKNALEEQVQSLEKELENSTEVGMELNRMLSEILSSESGSDVLKANVEHLQRQLVEQQSTINSVNETLAVTNTENHELRLELELSNKKVLDLQAELDKLLLNILKIEEEKESQQSTLENQIANLRQKCEDTNNRLNQKEEHHINESKQLKSRLEQTERKLELKTKEHQQLTDSFKQLKVIKNDEKALQNLLEVGGMKAELQLLKSENQRFAEKIQQDEEQKVNYEKKSQAAVEEIQLLKERYDEADKLRVETQTKLEVLSNYFKDREAQWQKELSKHEALWAEKEGEATSTTERIKFMQEQLQNYKVQTESLKQEIMSQEIELKSQISVLEKKAHENWVSARQAERKLEETKQEAAQLRHRLTLRERAIQEDKNQHRLQSPIEQNGDMPVSPLESPASPPLLYGTRDHITTSPPLPGLPPFLPPPPGVPFMPPPLHGVPPFIPPPPFPGDHRPPPLGRMSSPPLNSRYSPSSRGYSPYDRNSSSPSDSEYGTSPPHRRSYNPFNNRADDRRDYKRPPQGRSNGRNLGKGGGSSGSGHSNESLEKISRQQSKV